MIHEGKIRVVYGQTVWYNESMIFFAHRPEKMQKKKKFSTDMKSLTKETEISFYKSSGPGGQKKNKTESSVRLRHSPSGITVIATEQRSQSQNRELAFKRLQRKLAEMNRVPKPRVKTQVSKQAKERMLEVKRRLADKKRQRQLKGKISDER